MVALLCRLPERIHENVNLGWREVGVGQRAVDGVRVHHGLHGWGRCKTLSMHTRYHSNDDEAVQESAP